MKIWYDRKARQRVFRVGDKVLVLLPIAGNNLLAGLIECCINDLNHEVSTSDHRKQRQLCHVNT